MSDKILEAARRAKKLILAAETKYADAYSNGPSPADFGEHLEIPEEAIAPVGVITETKLVEEKD